MKSNLMLDEIQVTVIYSRTSLVAVMSECCVERVICKSWTGLCSGTLVNSADPNQGSNEIVINSGPFPLAYTQ